MFLQILLNLLIAVIWMFLNSSWSASGFLVGFVIGLVLIGLFRRIWPNDFYVKKVWAILKLLMLFNKELVISSITVIRQIVRPRLNIRPGILAYSTELRSNWELTLLSCLITLTPGTLTLEVSSEGNTNTLYIHAMDVADAELLVNQIRGSFERAIMEVTRK